MEIRKVKWFAHPKTHIQSSFHTLSARLKDNSGISNTVEIMIKIIGVMVIVAISVTITIVSLTPDTRSQIEYKLNELTAVFSHWDWSKIAGCILWPLALMGLAAFGFWRSRQSRKVLEWQNKEREEMEDRIEKMYTLTEKLCEEVEKIKALSQANGPGTESIETITKIADQISDKMFFLHLAIAFTSLFK